MSESINAKFIYRYKLEVRRCQNIQQNFRKEQFPSLRPKQVRNLIHNFFIDADNNYDMRISMNGMLKFISTCVMTSMNLYKWLTLWSRSIFEKLIIPQMTKIYAVYWTKSIIKLIRLSLLFASCYVLSYIMCQSAQQFYNKQINTTVLVFVYCVENVKK
jgi:hypothetical protein